MAERITDEPERKMVERLFSTHKELICDTLDIPCAAVCRFGVTSPIITDKNSKPGDIDALVACRAEPQKAFALEFKRIKVTAQVETDKLNKLNGISAGCVQAADLSRHGFYKTYFALVVQADVQKRAGPPSIFKAPLSGTIDTIYKKVAESGLPEEVGILYVENTQPADDSYEALGGIGARVIREALPQTQSETLTRLIAEVIK